MVLSNDFYCKIVLKYLNIWMIFYSFNKRRLDFCTSTIFVVKNTKFRVSALFMKVEIALVVFVKIHTPVYKCFNLLWSIFHHFTHNFLVAYSVARNKRVRYMFLKIVGLICHRSNTALRIMSVRFFQFVFTKNGNLTFVCHF